jgi:hypothetical protein
LKRRRSSSVTRSLPRSRSTYSKPSKRRCNPMRTWGRSRNSLRTKPRHMKSSISSTSKCRKRSRQHRSSISNRRRRSKNLRISSRKLRMKMRSWRRHQKNARRQSRRWTLT